MSGKPIKIVHFMCVINTDSSGKSWCYAHIFDAIADINETNRAERISKASLNRTSSDKKKATKTKTQYESRLYWFVACILCNLRPAMVEERKRFCTKCDNCDSLKWHVHNNAHTRVLAMRCVTVSFIIIIGRWKNSWIERTELQQNYANSYCVFGV